MYSIEFKNQTLNHADVIGWNLTSGKAGVWSGLYGERAYFPLRSEANKFIRILMASGYSTENMVIVKY